jgi:heme O synthase-like polyprenyltransferase
VRRAGRADLPMRVFRFSINYLAILFAALLVDHYLPRAVF